MYTSGDIYLLKMKFKLNECLTKYIYESKKKGLHLAHKFGKQTLFNQTIELLKSKYLNDRDDLDKLFDAFINFCGSIEHLLVDWKNVNLIEDLLYIIDNENSIN